MLLVSFSHMLIRCQLVPTTEISIRPTTEIYYVPTLVPTTEHVTETFRTTDVSISVSLTTSTYTSVSGREVCAGLSNADIIYSTGYDIYNNRVHHDHYHT